MPIVIFAEGIGVNQTVGVRCLMFWILRCTRLHFVVVFESVANFVASCGKPYKKQAKLMDCILQTHGIDRCMEMKEKADDLETFCEGFRRLCWSYGPNRLIIMLYLLMIQLWDESWEAQYYMKFVCSVFRLRFLLHMIVFLDFYFEKRAPMLFPVWGLAWVSCVRRRELRASGILSK